MADRYCQRRLGRWMLAASLCWGVTVLAVGCAKETRYQVLSFFFDGVPDPNAPAVKPGQPRPAAGAAGPSRSPVASTHKPYAEENCKACHKGDSSNPAFLLSAASSGICMDCHKESPKQHPVMHGPVAAQACLWCHAPHESPAPALLREPAPGICLQCHDRTVLGNKPPEHQDVKRDCLDCHYGHGGTARYLLKPQQAGPTTRTALALPPEVR